VIDGGGTIGGGDIAFVLGVDDVDDVGGVVGFVRMSDDDLVMLTVVLGML